MREGAGSGYNAPMRHIPVLVYVLSLLCGMGCLTVLTARYARRHDRRSAWAVRFFGAYSLLVAVMTVFAYTFVNLPMSPVLTLRFASAVIAAMVPVQLTQPPFVFADRDRVMTRFGRTLLHAGAAVTALSALLLFFLGRSIPDSRVLFLALPAFSSFGITIALSMIVALRSKRSPCPPSPRDTRMTRIFTGAYILLIGFAAYEFWNVNAAPGGSDWGTVSLPLLYMLTAAQFALDTLRPDSSDRAQFPAPGPEGSPLRLPEAVVTQYSLTSREAEMSRLILAGFGNKEIAGELGISENTVRNHIYNLYHKLGIQKRMDLVAIASEKGETGTKIPEKRD